ncbi:hypothetical protein EJB05_13778, partial [Eragrostis curvula]
MVDTATAPPLKQLASRRPRSAVLSNTDSVSVSAVFSNANTGGGAGQPNKPKAKTVASRYLAPFSKPRSANSPAQPSVGATTSRRSGSPAPRRAASATERPNAVSAADAAAFSASAAATTRTLSVAFQSPTYCLDTSKARSVSPASATLSSPEKRKSSTAATSVRSKVSEGGQNTYRWPASGPSGHDAGAFAASLEHSASNHKRTAAAARPRAFDETPRRASVDGASANEYLRALPSSDTEDSASSGGSRDGLGSDRPASGPRPSPRSVMASSARFARDAVGTRSDRFAYPASVVASPSPVKKRSLFTGLLSSSPFSMLPLKKQPSPVGSAVRTTESPSRPRRSMELPGLALKLQGKACSLGSDMNVTQNKAEEEHQLKLLYNRHLQWRLANAQAAAARSSQRAAAEKTLIGAWITILRKSKSIADTKLQLQLFRNNCKLMAILRGQMVYLEEWSSLERVYANSFSGTAQALNATVLRLPVSEGAMADIQALKNAVGSAIDVMQRIGYSTISTGKCLGVPALQSCNSRTCSDGTVQRVAVHTSFNAREALQSPRAEDTNEPEKAWAFSVVFRLPSPFPN